VDHQLLIERLRLQSIIQRLMRTHGADQCLEIMQEALVRELPGMDKYRVQTRPQKQIKHMA
jgi:hypothetical protein